MAATGPDHEGEEGGLLGRLPGSDVCEFLHDLADETLAALYDSSPPTCLAVFGSLPDVCKHLMLRMLYVVEPLPLRLVAGWLSHSGSDPRCAGRAEIMARPWTTCYCLLAFWLFSYYPFQRTCHKPAGETHMGSGLSGPPTSVCKSLAGHSGCRSSTERCRY